jgi:hypothetical protein
MSTDDDVARECRRRYAWLNNTVCVCEGTFDLTDVADGYRAMADREALKVLVQP